MRPLACCLLLAALRFSATQEEGDGAVSTSCIARGFATPSLSSAQVLANARLWHVNITRRSPGAVLGFVTPWNSRGYADALRWHAKLMHVSPCWHTLRGEAPRVEVGGEPDAAGVEFSSSLAALPRVFVSVGASFNAAGAVFCGSIAYRGGGACVLNLEPGGVFG